jgi:hypothetical protein
VRRCRNQPASWRQDGKPGSRSVEEEPQRSFEGDNRFGEVELLVEDAVPEGKL